MWQGPALWQGVGFPRPRTAGGGLDDSIFSLEKRLRLSVSPEERRRQSQCESPRRLERRLNAVTIL